LLCGAVYGGVVQPKRNLIARGIIPEASRAEPNPFPGFRFTPDPRS
jgi:hypothetical protein